MSGRRARSRLLLAIAVAAATLGAPGPAAARKPTTTYRFPLGCTDVQYSRSHHDYPATDLFAKVGCRFLAPIDGVVDEVSRKDRWDPDVDAASTRGGLSVSIVGTDGVRYYGSHLSEIADGIRRGIHVEAGQLLGRVGRSGNARYTASHLHFGISWPTARGQWWIRRGEVPPAPYLDAWRRGRDKSPAAEVAERRAAAGDATCSRGC